jgi:DNA-binding response OmpR family regulator
MTNDTNSNQKTILIIDDIPDAAGVLPRILTNAGFKVRIAEDGKTGIQMVEKMSPDLILLDIMMPEMDGFEVCQQLKSQEKTRDIPIIFLTALVDSLDKAKGFELGAVDYITKPFQGEQVIACVNAHLSNRKECDG